MNHKLLCQQVYCFLKIYTVMKEKTMFHQLTDLYIEALELEIQKKER